MDTRQGHLRYTPFPGVELPDRAWPARTQTRAPRWLSTDLRDGNQALAVPMSPGRKLAMFDLLVGMGYTEIEVGFPVASRDDHDFVRMLIEQDRIPDGVRISVLVQAKDDHIKRSVAALRGARSVGLHVFNATCPVFRTTVFSMTRQECRSMAVEGALLTAKYAERDLAGSDVVYQYSPELFNETELDFSLEVCEAVLDVWQPERGREVILNFPATVERATPNVFADQIEWLDRNLSRREHLCLSIHPHNDRGTAIAATELAVLAGADRVEGCLFGGGERAGNVCLATLGLNLYSQGIDPGIDFSDIERVRRTVEECTGMDVHKRHPYAGELVFTAFSGSHQDAINKGFAASRQAAEDSGRVVGDLSWTVPYLPIDPGDLGRSYDEIVRITSQSGKGGIAYVMSTWHGMRLPRELQIDFARVVQRVADADGAELSPDRIRRCFEREYLTAQGTSTPFAIPAEPVGVTLFLDGVDAEDGGRHEEAVENLAPVLAPWGMDCRELHIIGPSEGGPAGDSEIKAYASCRIGGREYWGVGLNADVHTAAFSAVRAAVERERVLTAAATAAAAVLRRPQIVVERDNLVA